MNLRHAAALALVVWYLMVPPVHNGKHVNVPIAQWVNLKGFDSASACENFADRLLKVAKEKGNNTQIIAAQVHECIATDDPRLKGK